MAQYQNVTSGHISGGHDFDDVILKTNGIYRAKGNQ